MYNVWVCEQMMYNVWVCEQMMYNVWVCEQMMYNVWVCDHVGRGDSGLLTGAREVQRGLWGPRVLRHGLLLPGDTGSVLFH